MSWSPPLKADSNPENYYIWRPCLLWFFKYGYSHTSSCKLQSALFHSLHIHFYVDMHVHVWSKLHKKSLYKEYTKVEPIVILYLIVIYSVGVNTKFSIWQLVILLILYLNPPGEFKIYNMTQWAKYMYTLMI